MGCMSASDAAPLPRLGEVFFDVRGDSRSMRLSWYADTGVAVFSIWQGGTCTGTFRLPMDDLARMIEALRRGPQGQRAGRREPPGEAGREVPPGRGRGRGRSGGQEPAGGPGHGRHADACRVRRPARPAPGRAAPGAGLPRRGAGRLRDRPGPGLPGGVGGLSHRPARPGLPDPGRPGTRRSRPPGPTAVPPRGTARVRATPRTRDTRTARPAVTTGGAGRRDTRRCPPPVTTAPASPAATAVSRVTSPVSPAGPGTRTSLPPRNTLRGTRGAGTAEPGHPEVPATGDYRAGQSGSHRRPPGGGYPGAPPYHPYSGQQGIADYPGEAPDDDSGAYPAGPDYGEGAEWDDTADHSVEEYGSEPEESFPYGPPPGNHDRRERGRYPGRH